MRKKKKFMDGVQEQVIKFNDDPIMCWAVNVATPGLGAFFCLILLIFSAVKGWWWLAFICLLFVSSLGNKWYVYKYKFGIRKPNKKTMLASLPNVSNPNERK